MTMTQHAGDAAPLAPAPFSADTWLEEHGAGDILLTADGWLVEANRAAEHMFRLPAGQPARGLNFRRFCRTPARFAETVQAIEAAGYLENWDGDLVAFDGSPLYTVVNFVGQFDADRALSGIRACLFNITEWRRGQERSLFGQRVEAIGRLAGGVAHDFNNLLTVISGHAECLALGIPASEPLHRSVAAIQASAARAATLTQKLLAFGRRQVLQPRIVDLGELAQTVEADLRRTYGHRVTVDVEVTGPVWPVKVDPVQMERAFGTIAAHAVDLMDEAGRLSFRVENAVIGYEHSRAFIKPGHFVRLSISCAGLSLDLDAHIRMFEPFFTEQGRLRDGLGMAAVFGLIKQSGGYIWLDVDGPRHTTFTILLPTETPVVTVPAAGPRAPATILVLDDDDAVRGLIVKLLQHQGYSVLQAATPDTAHRLSQTHAVDLLITDLVLDGMRGDEVAAALVKAQPGVRLMYISGHPDVRALRPFDPTRTAFLEKPFSGAQLVDRVRALLEP